MAITLTSFATPLGTMTACATDAGICYLGFSDPLVSKTDIQSLSSLLNDKVEEGVNDHTENLSEQLKEYFSGMRKEFELPLVLPGTDFQKKVWEELLSIPFGETRSYLQQANSLGNPGAIRAVAAANGRNRIAILIPCHRVIGSNGKLTGYGGGLWRKRWLLDFESKFSNEVSFNAQQKIFFDE